MIIIDITKLTAGEVDLLEDTLNEQLASHPAFAHRIITFQDVLGEVRSLAKLKQLGDDTQELKPTTHFLPMGKMLRALELVHLRRSNPQATWADTGQNLLIPDVGGGDESEAEEAPEEASWPAPDSPTAPLS